MAVVGDGASYLSRASDLPTVRLPLTLFYWAVASAQTATYTTIGLSNQTGAVGGTNRGRIVAQTVAAVSTNDAGTVQNASVASIFRGNNSWQAVACTYRSTTSRSMRYARGNGQQNADTDTPSSVPTDFNTLGIGASVVITPVEFLPSTAALAFASFWPFELSEPELLLLLNGLHPVNNGGRIRRPAQCYPLLSDGVCMVSGLSLAQGGASGMTWDGRSPNLKTPLRMRPMLALVPAAASGQGRLVAQQRNHAVRSA